MDTEAFRPRRVAIVGTGSRAQIYTKALAARPGYRVVALCDTSATRMQFHNRLLASSGEPPASQWPPADFAAMLRAEQVDQVVVASVDSTHDVFIVAALEAGCEVLTEKPLTIDAKRCERIVEAVERTGISVDVAFNYRFNPVHGTVHRLLGEGVVGEILSVHFEWMLDVRHGADYFRRWHRAKAESGGLLVHKSSHHFDLVNWWLRDTPQAVFAFGRLGFYGPDAGSRHGVRRDYVRAHGATAAADDPFALHLGENDVMTELYLAAEQDNGYVRDQNVFDGLITIEDDLAVLVRYATGATMSYHLTAYSPCEGYRIAFNGSRGRVELYVEESAWQPKRSALDTDSGLVHGGAWLPNAGSSRLLVRPHWQEPYEVPLAIDHAGHGGGDARMLDAIFGTIDRSPGADRPDPDPRRATHRDGIRALAVGIAGNLSLESGLPVAVTDAVPGAVPL